MIGLNGTNQLRPLVHFQQGNPSVRYSTPLDKLYDPVWTFSLSLLFAER